VTEKKKKQRKPAEAAEDLSGLVFADLSTEEYLAKVDADVRTRLGHPAVDPQLAPFVPRKRAKRTAKIKNAGQS